jgi:alkanesulfonate monooxygenase
MQYGMLVEPQLGGTYEDLLRVASWAEGFGLGTFARSDHYLANDKSRLATDALATLAGLARETGSIELSVLVSPLTFRHPAVIAKTAATIDEMSGGRLALGVGTGWMESEHEKLGMELYPLRERFSRLFETLQYLRIAFGREPGPFAGRHYGIGDVDVHPKPTGRLPIVVGGGGAHKTPSLAGRFADEYNMFVTDADSLTSRLDVMRAAAKEAERDPEEILISFVGTALIGDDDADYRERLAAGAAKRGIEPAELEERYASRGLPIGTADKASEIVSDYAASGVQRFYLQVFEPIDAIDTDDLERQFAAITG